MIFKKIETIRDVLGGYHFVVDKFNYQYHDENYRYSFNFNYCEMVNRNVVYRCWHYISEHFYLVTEHDI